MTGRVNIPNQITLARLVLAVVFVVLLSLFQAGAPAAPAIAHAAFWVFLVAALTDVLDGYLARRWGQVTSFGRIVDPFVDKVIVCSAFLLFAGANFTDPATGHSLTHVAPWMAILILARELLVSALRAESEQTGRQYAALWAGKLKMFIQSFTACLVLGTIAFGWAAPLEPAVAPAVWLTVAITLASMISYVQRSWNTLFSRSALVGQPPASPPPPDHERPS